MKIAIQNITQLIIGLIDNDSVKFFGKRPTVYAKSIKIFIDQIIYINVEIRVNTDIYI